MRSETSDFLGGDLSFRDMAGIVKRQKLVVAITAAAVFVAAIFYTASTPPRFRSTARILIESAPNTATNDTLGQMSISDAVFDVPTQVQVLQSQDIMSQTIQEAKLDLGANPDLWPNLTVQQVSGTNVIQVSVDARQPGVASRVSDALPTVYRRYVQARQRDAVERAVLWLTSRVGEERAALVRAQLSLEAFKKDHKVVDVADETSMRLSRLNSADAEQAAAESQIRAAQAEIDELVRARNALPPTIDQPETKTNNEKIEQEKQKLELMKAQRKTLLLTYREDSLPVRKIDSDIASQQTYVDNLAKTTKSNTQMKNPALREYDDRITQARAGLKGAIARAASVRGRATASGNNLRNLTPVTRQQQDLEGAVNGHKEAISHLSASIDDLRLKDNSLKTPVSNISEASSPSQIAPRWSMNMIVALVFGLLLGAILGLVRDTLQDRVSSDRDARAASGLDILARIPICPRRINPLIVRSGDTLTLDRYRLLRSNLVLAAESRESAIVPADGPNEEPSGNGHFHPSLLLPYGSPKLTSLMVTSTFAAEGKSTVAMNLATTMALDGRSVILVDANLRAPITHRSFDVDQQPGLTEVLYKKASLDDALRPTSVDGLRLLPSGELPLNPSGALASAEMLELHAELSRRADVVVYDTVSSYALADAQALAAIVGSIVYVARIGTPKKDDLREAVGTLALTNARILGVVLNQDPTARVVLS